MNHFWKVPPIWKGRRGFIIGGGPSVGIADLDLIRDAGKIIAVNDAAMLLPCDVLYYADRRWSEWPHNRELLQSFSGEFIVTRIPHRPGDRLAKQVGVDHRETTGLSRSPCTLAGLCGGANALNLAYLFGLNPIILIGYDMKGGNWHDRHLQPAKPGCFENDFMPYFERMAPELERDGVDVINANPDSALECFRRMTLQDAIAATDGGYNEGIQGRRMVSAR